jgi:hypothetical protein
MAVTVKRYFKVLLRLLWEEIRYRVHISDTLKVLLVIVVSLSGFFVFLGLTALMLEGILLLTTGFGFYGVAEALALSVLYWVAVGASIYIVFSIRNGVRLAFRFFKDLDRKVRNECSL